MKINANWCEDEKHGNERWIIHAFAQVYRLQFLFTAYHHHNKRNMYEDKELTLWFHYSLQWYKEFYSLLHPSY